MGSEKTETRKDQNREPRVRVPAPDAQERPVDWDIEEGKERMQGEQRGEQESSEQR